MSLPNLLLVDDSDAILAFERAALLGHYTTAVAHNGQEALACIRELKPAAVILDLSMPVMDGEQVLARLQADPELARIPVVIVSSERERAQACLDAGARAFVAKPIRAEDLRATIARVLSEARQRARAGALAVLFVELGGLRLALPLHAVAEVLHLPEATPLAGGPSFLREMFELRGRPVVVLDLARRLRLEYRSRPIDRMVLVLRLGEAVVGVTADAVFDPEEIASASMLPNRALGIANHPPLARLLEGVIQTQSGLVPLLRPEALLSSKQLARLQLLVNDDPGAREDTWTR